MMCVYHMQSTKEITKEKNKFHSFIWLDIIHYIHFLIFIKKNKFLCIFDKLEVTSWRQAHRLKFL